MPVVTFNRDDLCGLLGRRVGDEVLLDRIPQLGADVHSYDASSGTMSIEFFPDRPDLYSVEGAARALRPFLGIEEGLRRYEASPSGTYAVVDPSVDEVRGQAAFGIVEGVEMTDALIRSLMELQEKLHLTMGRKRAKVSIGVHDLAPLKPPFTYKAVEPGSVRFVPLAMEEELDLFQILKRNDKGVEYARILDGKDRYPLLVDSAGSVLSFPPIINGRLTTVTERTRDVLVDVTGTDHAAVSGALNIVCAALAERGGRIRTMETRSSSGTRVTPDLEPRRWSIDVAATSRLLGVKLTAEEAASALRRMGYDASGHGGAVDVLAPAYRLDLMHPADVMEDVAKGYGYERFGSSLPSKQTFASQLETTRAADMVRQLMVGHGLLEATTLMLSSRQQQFEWMRLPDGDVVEVLNPISEDHTCLRASLVPGLMTVLRRNKRRDLPQELFEVGNVVVGTRRQLRLAAVTISAKASFTSVKSLTESVLRDLSVPWSIAPSSSGTWLDGRGADVIVDGRVIGSFGELHPEVITSFELGHPVTAMELELGPLTAGRMDRLA